MSSSSSKGSSKRLKIPKDEPHSNSESGDNPPATTVTKSTVRLSKTSPCNNASPCRWTTSAIYTLISAFKLICNQEAQGKSYDDIAELWSDISKTLCQRKFAYTPEQCRTKWSLLKRLYYHVATEEHIQKFEFFKYLHEIFEEPRLNELLKTYQHSKSKKRKRTSTESLEQLEIKQELNSVHEGEDTGEETHIEVEFLNASSNYEQEKEITSEHKREIAYIKHTDENLEFDGGCVDYEMPAPYMIENPEDMEPKEEIESYDHSALLQGKLSTDQLPAYVQTFKEVIDLQEQRRDERHREKLKVIQEHSERLLAQHKDAIAMHRKLMEQLIDNL